jgi:hypothetical protein
LPMETGEGEEMNEGEGWGELDAGPDRWEFYIT